jgi:holin-like protein
MNALKGFVILLALQLCGEILARMLSLPIPGPVVGLLLLLTGLALIPGLATLVEEAAQTLLSHLSLLFIPAGVGVVVHLGRLDGAVLGVTMTLAISTLIGLSVTALSLQYLMRGRKTRNSTS